jgi:MFS superfamily sulfate permease-like transporter
MDLFLPQIPLTITNAILATSLLAAELFHRQISPDRLSRTIGVMSLSSSLLGGFPMCHGAGGIAAHFRFGARSGAAMVTGGIILIAISTLVTDPAILSMIPQGIFGALLLAVAIELIKGGIKTDSLLVPAVMAIIAIPAGITVAFIAGLILTVIIPYAGRKKEIKKQG